MRNQDIIVKIPAEFCSGEPGDMLHPRVRRIIQGLVRANYWPLDFGDSGMDDDGNEYQELIFCHAENANEAIRNAGTFIMNGGNV